MVLSGDRAEASGVPRGFCLHGSLARHAARTICRILTATRSLFTRVGHQSVVRGDRGIAAGIEPISGVIIGSRQPVRRKADAARQVCSVDCVHPRCLRNLIRQERYLGGIAGCSRVSRALSCHSAITTPRVSLCRELVVSAALRGTCPVAAGPVLRKLTTPGTSRAMDRVLERSGRAGAQRDRRGRLRPR